MTETSQYQKQPAQVTINLPPLEDTTDPETKMDCFNWRNWLAFLLASIIIGTACWVVIKHSNWLDKTVQSYLMPVEENEEYC